jgi:four helix bundle protein
MKDYQGFRDLRCYQLAFELATEVFHTTKSFPPEEKYSLIDQIRRSSRSVAGNIAEAWKKRRYQKLFVNKLVDAAGEAAETEVWLDTAQTCGYLVPDRHSDLLKRYDELERMLHSMISQPEKFCH